MSKGGKGTDGIMRSEKKKTQSDQKNQQGQQRWGTGHYVFRSQDPPSHDCYA